MIGPPLPFAMLINDHSSSWEEHQLNLAFIAGWLHERALVMQ